MKLFNDLDPKKKKYAGWALIVVILFLIGLPLYQQKQKNKSDKKQVSKAVVDNEVGTFEDGLLSQVRGELKAVRDEQKKFQDEIRSAFNSIKDLNRSELAKHKASLEKDFKRLKSTVKPVDTEAIIQKAIAKSETENKKKSIFREKKEKEQLREKAPREKKAIPSKPKSTIINSRPQELASVNRKTSSVGKKDSRSRKKEVADEESVYLPPSYMKADLLSGVVAPTSQKVAGQSSSPMLLRIKDLAVLPNQYKQDTKGCFVIADGEADLSQERVESRLVTLSCISKEGESIIDQKIKGWIVDKDGRAGMRGRVVAKFGAHMARSTFAGALDGFGKAFEQTAWSTSSSYWGTASMLDNTPTGLARAGAGGGITEAAETLKDFYINLANQTLPVIEVGPTKEVTLIISEGVSLKIRKRT